MTVTKNKSGLSFRDLTSAVNDRFKIKEGDVLAGTEFSDSKRPLIEQILGIHKTDPARILASFETYLADGIKAVAPSVVQQVQELHAQIAAVPPAVWNVLASAKLAGSVSTQEGDRPCTATGIDEAIRMAKTCGAYVLNDDDARMVLSFKGDGFSATVIGTIGDTRVTITMEDKSVEYFVMTSHQLLRTLVHPLHCRSVLDCLRQA